MGFKALVARISVMGYRHRMARMNDVLFGSQSINGFHGLARTFPLGFKSAVARKVRVYPNWALQYSHNDHRVQVPTA